MKYTFSNKKKNYSVNSSALNCKKSADLIYIDPPYVSENGSHVDYHSRYHFLEGIVNYDNFVKEINFKKLNHEVQINKNLEFESKNTIYNDIKSLIKKYKKKIIVFSYRNKGIPSIKEIENIFLNYDMDCKIHVINNHSYALNKSNKVLNEYLFIAKSKNGKS